MRANVTWMAFIMDSVSVDRENGIAETEPHDLANPRGIAATLVAAYLDDRASAIVLGVSHRNRDRLMRTAADGQRQCVARGRAGRNRDGADLGLFADGKRDLLARRRAVVAISDDVHGCSCVRGANAPRFC